MSLLKLASLRSTGPRLASNPDNMSLVVVLPLDPTTHTTGNPNSAR